MNEENKDTVDVELEVDTVNTEELKENLSKQSNWLRLLWTAGFTFVYYFAMPVLWLIVVAQFLFVLFTNNPNTNIIKLSEGFKNYMIQILNFITYQADEKPFPFNEFPKSEDNS